MSEKLYSFSKGFKKARKAKKLTQESFANSFGVSVETVRNWEQGKNIPNFGVIEQLCQFFDCDMDYLFNNLEYKNHDIKFICEYTGLSENAIKYLHEKSRSPRIVKVLNLLLKPGNFDNALFHIDKFMEATNLYTGLTKIRRERNEQIISDCLEKDGDLRSYNYPYNDSLDSQIKEYETKMDVEELRINQHFNYIIDEMRKIGKSKQAPAD